MKIKIQTTLETFDWSIWHYHFPIDKKTTQLMSSADHKRVVCIINDSLHLHCALMPMGEGSYIMINKANRDKLGLQAGDKVSIELEKDSSEYGIPMPESLQVMLDQEEEGSKHFHSLTPGKQRSLIYIVSKVKSLDKQINKSLAILDHLKDVQGKLDFRMLNAKIKEYNSREGYY